MMTRLTISILVLVIVCTGLLAAEEQKTAAAPEVGQEDADVVAVLDILELMALVEQMELLQSMKLIVEGKIDEEKK